jgi:hypothetical protein
VGDQDHRGVLAGQPGQQLGDAGPGRRVEVAGRLVGQQHRGPPDDRPGDGDPLTFAAGELPGAVPETAREAHFVQCLGGAFAPDPDRGAAVEQPARHVVEHGEMVEQEELLEDEAEPPGPHLGQLRIGQPRRVRARDAHGAGGRPFERAEDAQEGRLAGAGRAGHGDRLSGLHDQVDAGERGDPGRTRIGLADRVEFERRGHAAGTSTVEPARIPSPLISTIVSEKRPGVTPTSRRAPVSSR